MTFAWILFSELKAFAVDDFIVACRLVLVDKFRVLAPNLKSSHGFNLDRT